MLLTTKLIVKNYDSLQFILNITFERFSIIYKYHSCSITTDAVNSNLDQAEVYNIMW